MDLHLHDKVELKKAHQLMLPRSKAEKSIRRILTEGELK